MSINKPEATSTPTPVPNVRGRQSIKDHNYFQSPIKHGDAQLDGRSGFYTGRTSKSEEELSPKNLIRNSHSPRNRRRNRSPAESESDEDDSQECIDNSQDETDNRHEEFCEENKGEATKNSTRGSCSLLIFLPLAFCALVVLLSRHCASDTPQDLLTKFNSLKKAYSKQKQDFWRQIKVNIEEVSVLNQPRSILFLYEKDNRKTMDDILNEVSQAGLCHLSDCSKVPVTIEGSELNSSSIINDYGSFLSEYREDLEDNAVMVVNNLQEIPGQSAQVFHSICDDYNPLVRKALILFTLKVDKLPEGYPMPYVEKLLLRLWNDIGVDDKFYPLFTRISGTILTVERE